MSLRKIGVFALVVGALAVGLFATRHHSSTSSPSTANGTFAVHRTTTLKEEAGTLVLRYTPSLKTVVAIRAITDKAYFSLVCAGRSTPVRVGGDGQWQSLTCRLNEVRYSDNSASSGVTTLHPQH